MKKSFLLLSLTALIAMYGCSGGSSTVEISNDRMSVGFDRQTGRLVSLKDKANSYEFIDSSAVSNLPWRLEKPSEGAAVPEEYDVSFKKTGKDQVKIVWKAKDESGLEVEVNVSLEKDRPLSHWRATFNSLKQFASEGVSCPVVTGIKAYREADLATPSWLGNLIHDPGENATEEKPAVYSCGFPGSSLQLMTLYDRTTLKNGLYLSSQDVESMSKSLTVSLKPGEVECSAFCRVPDKAQTESFTPGYDVVVGSFDGDWFDAAEIYREWAVNQRFCKESRFHNGESPEWLQQTAFWIWNRGRSSNVLKEAEDVQRRLNLPVNTYWHWWHGCAYDEGFPEYVPPREGIKSFVDAVAHAHEQGIHSLVYMNSYQWGDSTESWEKEGARQYAAQREDGETYRHVFEIFSGKGLTPMCMATQFWRDKYSSLCDTVVNSYHVDGVYMDQACSSMPCYNPAHGHTLGGGNYWVEGFHKLTDQIRGKFKEGTDAMLAGEGSAEDWIPVLDDFLTLDCSRERYAGVGKSEPIPLFQAVYHDYAMTYGSYSSLVYPPYDELWPKEFRPANAETLLPDKYNMQFRMEQARSFTWGMQPTLANYHSFLFDERPVEMEYLSDLIKTRYNALDYLLYGQFIGLPKFESEEVTIPMSKISIYAGRKGDNLTEYEKTVGTILSGAWLSKDGNVGIALTNISDEDQEISFAVDSEKYGIPASGSVNVISADGKKEIGKYSSSEKVTYTVPKRSSCVVELTK